jgi:hypothetical protein
MADPQVYASDLKGFQAQLDRIRADIRNLRTPTDSQFNRTVARMLELVDNLDSRVDAAIQARSYTTAQIDSKDQATLTSAKSYADTGLSGKQNTIGVLDPAHGGTGTANGYSNMFASGPYRAAWVLSDGTLGTSQSSRKVKTDFHVPDISLEQLLSVDWVGYRYIQDVNENSDSALPRIGMIAEDLDDAGLGIFVVYDDVTAEPVGIDYTMLSVAALHAAKLAHQRCNDMEQRITVLEQLEHREES